ncbi:hypothetical protein P153DRAFT_412718 [Dothidotthia symphoricarpi CBS 119687]|uniref:Uncharacterized protein n=1 Tax=Dothidotthia symphoricarpi CBS 119687 TaxID=1392245 RepID=A0A6A6AMU9_9PLEO|nr:uncharacterized protein P153DRAFT_412718 [Dothidotthia symphoricarpi CBS 119687]KAF2133110.1 hypothetical protein P153DRAFT_412718 [Dothidotthia symphoricarpi CBS 119687]
MCALTDFLLCELSRSTFITTFYFFTTTSSDPGTLVIMNRIMAPHDRTYVAVQTPDELFCDILDILHPAYRLDKAHLDALRDVLNEAIIDPRPTFWTESRFIPENDHLEFSSRAKSSPVSSHDHSSTSTCGHRSPTAVGDNGGYGPPQSIDQAFYFSHTDYEFKNLLPQVDCSAYEKPDRAVPSGIEERNRSRLPTPPKTRATSPIVTTEDTHDFTHMDEQKAQTTQQLRVGIENGEPEQNVEVRFGAAGDLTPQTEVLKNIVVDKDTITTMYNHSHEGHDSSNDVHCETEDLISQNEPPDGPVSTTNSSASRDVQTAIDIDIEDTSTQNTTTTASPEVLTQPEGFTQATVATTQSQYQANAQEAAHSQCPKETTLSSPRSFQTPSTTFSSSSSTTLPPSPTRKRSRSPTEAEDENNSPVRKRARS